MADEEKKEKTKDAAPLEKKKEIDEKAPTPRENKEGRSPDSSGEPEDVGIEVPAKFQKLVEEIEKMSVLELNALVKVFEKKFGVSAQAVAVAAPGGAGDDSGSEEKDSFTVELKAAGEQKIQVIKAIKELLGLGLKEAKDMVDGVPSVLKEGVKKVEAEEIKTKIETAGGSVELK